jgi:uncharacterized membrane protein
VKPREALRGEWPGLALLAVALAFGAVCLAPELRIGRAPLNDSVFHLAASERMIDAFARREPFLDPWVSEWSLGYPLWRSYQPLPHLLSAAVLWATAPLADHATAFAALEYVLLVLLPLSVYLGARLLGLRPGPSGLASLLALLPSGAGALGSYGMGYGGTTWRGSGLYTQLVALHALPLAIGAAARALDAGRRRGTAALLLAITALCHVVFGYVVALSATLLAIVGPAGERARRLVRLATIAVPAAVLTAWFAVPLALAGAEINHSHWEATYKWDSFGAPALLRELVAGRLLDAGRLPVLTLLLLVGTLAALRSLEEPLARRLLALTALWLGLFFGRETWGHLLLLVAMPADMHLHRLQAAFELHAVLLAAWGTDRTLRALAGVARPVGVAAALVVAALLVSAGNERAAYLEEGARWGRANLAALESERGDIEAALRDVRGILAERPGRVSAGPAAGWGNDFKIGSAPFYTLLGRARIDEVSFLYHSLSIPSDVMVLRDEGDPAQMTALGVRAVVAPRTRAVPAFYRLRGAHGRLAVYEVSREGYFGLADVVARYVGPRAAEHEPSAAWLASPLPARNAVVALDDDGDGPDGAWPSLARWEPLPAPPPTAAPCGEVSAETKEAETYRARVALRRPCHVLVRITWHRDLVALVDGAPTPLLRVTPGFGAVPVSAGAHEVVVRYAPGRLKPVLFVLGLVLFAGCARLLARPRPQAIEEAWTARLDATGARLATPRAAAAAALAAIALLALRPLFRGRLIEGHDALEYPPRLVEMARVLADGHVPPLWAPDLGAGHGQPLFEFAPPLVYLAALPLRAAGGHLADALQMALALLHAAGAVAVYRLGRRWGAPRAAAVGGAALWLLAPYTCLDLYVRAAFAEASAVAVAPIALLGLLRALDEPSPARIAWGGLAVALVPLAHNAGALLLLPAFGLLVLARAASAPRATVIAMAGAAVLGSGLGLSAFFWLPALLEKGFVHTDLLREGFLLWSDHAIEPAQLLWSPWGYGLSVPGPGDGMSFALGLPHLALAVAGLVLARRSPLRRSRAEAIAFAAIAAFGAWLATTWSHPLWQHLETLQYLAYPWRALMLPGLLLPLMAVAALAGLRARWAALLVAAVAVLNLAHTEPRGYLTFDDEYYAPASIAQKGIETSTREEYAPRWVERRPPFFRERLVARSGRVEVLDQRTTSAREELQVRAAPGTLVDSALFYYPGWGVTVDGRPVPIAPAPVDGTLRFELPEGEHRVVLELRPTPLRRGAALASLASLVSIAVLLFLPHERREPEAAHDHDGRRAGEPRGPRRRAQPGKA